MPPTELTARELHCPRQPRARHWRHPVAHVRVHARFQRTPPTTPPTMPRRPRRRRSPRGHTLAVPHCHPSSQTTPPTPPASARACGGSDTLAAGSLLGAASGSRAQHPPLLLRSARLRTAPYVDGPGYRTVQRGSATERTPTRQQRAVEGASVTASHCEKTVKILRGSRGAPNVGVAPAERRRGVHRRGRRARTKKKGAHPCGAKVLAEPSWYLPPVVLPMRMAARRLARNRGRAAEERDVRGRPARRRE